MICAQNSPHRDSLHKHVIPKTFSFSQLIEDVYSWLKVSFYSAEYLVSFVVSS